MGAVSYGQGGYVGTSMSVRAQEAYESGEMPMSKWTRGAIISAIKDYCTDVDLAYNPDIETMSRAKLAEAYLEYKSWHHTGRFARETEFFGLNEDAVCADFPEMTPDQIAERDEKAAEVQAAAAEWNSFMKARENAFAKRFGCNASSVLAYEAFHPERCTRFLAKRSKRVMNEARTDLSGGAGRTVACGLLQCLSRRHRRGHRVARSRFRPRGRAVR